MRKVINIRYVLDHPVERTLDELADKYGGRLISSGYSHDTRIKEVCLSFQEEKFTTFFLNKANKLEGFLNVHY